MSKWKGNPYNVKCLGMVDLRYETRYELKGAGIHHVGVTGA